MEIITEARELDETLKNKIVPLEGYSAMVVENDDEAAFAGEIVQQIKDYEKQVTAFFEEDKKLASKLHKNICAKEKAALEPAVTIRRLITNKINGYLTEKRRREEEARRLAEQKRLEVERAERERLTREAAEAQKAADDAAAKGDTDAAAALTEEANAKALESETVVIIPEVMPEVSKSIDTAAGKVSGRADIDLEITDKQKLVAALFAKGLEAFVEIDLGKLKRYCKDTQANFDGLRIKESVKASFRKGA